MPYATAQDMISRFGATEMLRLSSVDGILPETVNVVPVEQAIADSAAIIDSYLRKRYTVPLNPVPQVITRACCVLARYDLCVGGDREPATQVVSDRKDTIAWLAKIADGSVTLEDISPVAPTSTAFAQDRPRMYGLPGHGGLS